MADPYALIEENYQGALNQIKGQKETGKTQKESREKQAGQLHTETNRGFEIKYQQAVNPFGFNAEQRGVMGTGISDYFKNAALGTLLQGVGKSAQTYQDSMDTIGADWNNFLLELSAQEESARSTRNQAIMQQRQIDIENARAAAAAAAVSGGSSGTGGVDLGDDGNGGSLPVDYSQVAKQGTWSGSYATSQDELDMLRKAQEAQAATTEKWANPNYNPRSFFT